MYAVQQHYPLDPRFCSADSYQLSATLTSIIHAVRVAFPNVEDVYVTTAPLSAHSDFTSMLRVDGELFEESGMPHALVRWMARQANGTPTVTWNRWRVVPDSTRFQTCSEQTWRTVFTLCDLDEMWANGEEFMA